MSDLAWWFGWQPDDLWELTLDDIEMWLKEAQRQNKAGYTKATL
ncbi:GpE family phage tail protein [Phocoenobacter skyensis]|nr:GpE family phage tail protein [Pasteurella skyensis]MDP8162803.1 GpE family phage tail protein [Pasteurella skyensis]